MKGESRNIFKVACLYVTTIIGAGFASGQEIAQFFSNYYRGGFYGIILAGLLFSLVGYVVLDKVYTERIKNYSEFVYPTFGHFLGKLVEFVVSVFMLCVYCVMIAGLSNVLMQLVKIPPTLGILIASTICMIFILTSIKGVIALNSIITPILIVGIALIGIYVITFRDTSVFNLGGSVLELTDNWMISAVNYVSYNSIISITVMCSLLPYLKTRKTGRAGGILGGMLLCTVAFIINFAIFAVYPDSMQNELPVLNIVSHYDAILSVVYTFILALAMLTSAVTTGYCFVDRISSKTKVDQKLIAPIVCALVIPLAGIGFSNLISHVYPVFGYLGMFMLMVILIQWVRQMLVSLYKKKKP